MPKTLMNIFGGKTTSAAIAQKRDELIAADGPWTAHNFQLADGVFTFPNEHEDFEAKKNGHAHHLRRIFQGAADIAGKRIRELRVLDLGCLEGLYGIEFAMQGAEVVGLEGREPSVRKCNFAKEALGLRNITFVQDDVRNLSSRKYGVFDVVLCLGLLYHLDTPDVFTVTELLSEVCKRVLVLDTHVSLNPTETRHFKGKDYAGVVYKEHEDATPQDVRLQALWASLDNAKSFWPTRPSLYNLLSECGFTSVHTAMNPACPEQTIDRDTIFAIKGQQLDLMTSPDTNKLPVRTWPEVSVARAHPALANLEPARDD